MGVSYTYKTRKDLAIEVNYGGGVTLIEIGEREKETHAKITYAAD